MPDVDANSNVETRITNLADPATTRPFTPGRDERCRRRVRSSNSCRRSSVDRRPPSPPTERHPPTHVISDQRALAAAGPVRGSTAQHDLFTLGGNGVLAVLGQLQTQVRGTVTAARLVHSSTSYVARRRRMVTHRSAAGPVWAQTA
jgi:hypothetical protein